MKTEIFNTYAEFLNREDKAVNGVSPQFAKEHLDYIADNETNSGCWKGEQMYLVIDIAGRYLTGFGFNSYVHYDATKFSHKEAVLLAKIYNADIQEVRLGK